MAGTPTREELLGRIRAARGAWEETVAAVPRERLEEPGAAGADWSVKDVQAHLTADHRWLAGQLRAGLRGEVPTAGECYGHEETPPPGVDLADTEQRNRWRQTIDRRRALDEVLANAPRWADELEAAVAALPEAELARPYTFAAHAHIGHLRPAAGDEPRWPLQAIITSYADEHYAHHTADLRAAGRASEERREGGPPLAAPPRLAPLLA